MRLAALLVGLASAHRRVVWRVLEAGPKKSCTTYSPGMHLVQLPDLKRQFLLFVPRELVKSPTGVPLVMAFHGFSESPWYHSQFGGFSLLLERYGWLGIFPFGLNEARTNGLGGVRACCPPGCDEECCRNGKKIVGLWGDPKLACRWSPAQRHDNKFVEALAEWAKTNTCADSKKMFATGFSNGGGMVNYLGCSKPYLFRVVAPMASPNIGPEDLSSCKPAQPTSYVSSCGSSDYVVECTKTSVKIAQHWSKELKCTGAGGDGIVNKISATSQCTHWDNCAGGNFVEVCIVDWLTHSIPGHTSPQGFAFVPPGDQLNFTEYAFQKFSIHAGSSILFYGHPTEAEIARRKATLHSEAPPTLTDHEYLREGRLLGKDYVGPEESASAPSTARLLLLVPLLGCLLGAQVS